MLVLILSTITSNMLLSFFAIYLEELTFQSTEFQRKIDLTNTACNNLGLPSDVQTSVLIFIKNTHETYVRQTQLRQFMDYLKPSL